MIVISDESFERLIRIYKNICGLDPYIHYSTSDKTELINSMINEIGYLLGVK